MQTAWWWSALNNREEVSFLLCFEVWEEFNTWQGGEGVVKVKVYLIVNFCSFLLL